MRQKGFNRTLGHAPILMSLMALGLVVYAATTGWQTKLSGEGMAANGFQLLIFMQPVLVAWFLVTADWRRPLRIIGLVVLQVLAAGMALGALWYFESKGF